MGSVSLANCSIGRAKFYHASIGFPSKKRLSRGNSSCLNRPRHKTEKRGEKMKAHKLASIAAAIAFIGACATEPAKPAPAPAPKPVSQPAPKPDTAPPPPVAKAEPKPEPPKKPAVLILASTELFEFNKAVHTQEARTKLDSEVIAKLKDMKDVRYVIVNGHADRLGSAEYNQKLSEKRADA